MLAAALSSSILGFQTCGKPVGGLHYSCAEMKPPRTVVWMLGSGDQCRPKKILETQGTTLMMLAERGRQLNESWLLSISTRGASRLTSIDSVDGPSIVVPVQDVLDRGTPARCAGKSN